METDCSPPVVRYRQCAPLPQKHMCMHCPGIRDLATPGQILYGRQKMPLDSTLGQILVKSKDPAAEAVWRRRKDQLCPAHSIALRCDCKSEKGAETCYWILRLLPGMLTQLLCIFSNVHSIRPLHAQTWSPTTDILTKVAKWCKFVMT